MNMNFVFVCWVMPAGSKIFAVKMFCFNKMLSALFLLDTLTSFHFQPRVFCSQNDCGAMFGFKVIV